MGERTYAVLGMLAPAIAYLAIGASAAASPWFDWWVNALSDLGHSERSGVASIFNFGLLLSGFLATLYLFGAMRKHARYTAYCLLSSAFTLQLVAVFDEAYGPLHLTASWLLFISLGISSLAYLLERRSILALASIIIGLGAWIIHWAWGFPPGPAIPETLSSLAVTSWIVVSAVKIHFSEPS